MSSDSPASDRPADAEAPPATGLVLVVDDEADVAETTALMLEERGLDAIWESSARDGLEWLKERRDEIDCVVSDYQMPELDGLELLRAMRDVDPHLPFLLFTGRGSERIASDAIEAGVSGYIQKRGVEQYDRLANRARQAIGAEQQRRELEATRARFEALTQNTSFAIVTIDETSEIQYANDPVEEIFGYAPADLVGESLTKLMPDRLVEGHHEGIERYLATGEKHLDWDRIELPAVTKDGEEFPVGISFGERTNETSTLFTGIIHDITEQQSRQKALEREQERFRAVFESAMDAMFILDPESGTIDEANPAASEMLGYPRDRLRGMDVESIHPDDHAALLEYSQRVLAEEEASRFETVCHTASGETIPAEVAGSKLTTDAETRFLAVVRPHEDE